VAELGRIKGAAAGLTGVGKDGQPEYLAVVLPGGSQAPSFLMRAFLTTGPVRPAGKVEGVSYYQTYSFLKAPPGEKSKAEDFGPAFAMLPGVVLVGSPDAVKEAILRAKGKAEGDSLDKSEGLQEARKEASKEPGLLGIANPAELVPALEAVVKAAGKEEG